jgi:PAS domain S-box-containing protein
MSPPPPSSHYRAGPAEASGVWLTVQIVSPIADRAGGAVSDEQLLKLFVGAVTDYAIYALDPNGFVMTWNSGAEQIKGYSREEIHGQHFARFFTLQDQASGLPGKALETAKAGGRFASEGWRVRKNGSRFWASTVLQAVKNPA